MTKKAKKKTAKKTVRKKANRISRKPKAGLVEPLLQERPLLKANQRRRKQRMLNALEANMGTVQNAVIEVGIARKTHYNWIKDDPAYAAAVEDIVEGVGDFVEHQMLKSIRDQQPSVMIFYAKTKLKHRGYVERQEITGANGGEFKLGGRMAVDHAMQELPPEGISKILNKIVGGGGKAEAALTKLKKQHEEQRTGK